MKKSTLAGIVGAGLLGFFSSMKEANASDLRDGFKAHLEKPLIGEFGRNSGNTYGHTVDINGTQYVGILNQYIGPVSEFSKGSEAWNHEGPYVSHISFIEDDHLQTIPRGLDGTEESLQFLVNGQTLNTSIGLDSDSRGPYKYLEIGDDDSFVRVKILGTLEREDGSVYWARQFLPTTYLNDLDLYMVVNNGFPNLDIETGQINDDFDVRFGESVIDFYGEQFTDNKFTESPVWNEDAVLPKGFFYNNRPVDGWFKLLGSVTDREYEITDIEFTTMDPNLRETIETPRRSRMTISNRAAGVPDGKYARDGTEYSEPKTPKSIPPRSSLTVSNSAAGVPDGKYAREAKKPVSSLENISWGYLKDIFGDN